MIGYLLRGMRAPAGVQEAAPGGIGGEQVGRRPWVIHPFLIGLFPIVSLYGHNVYETPARDMILPMVLTWISTVVLWLIFRLISGDFARAGLAASLLIASFFGFRSFDEACATACRRLSRLWIYDESTRLSPLTATVLLTVLNLALFYLIFRRSSRFARWTPPLNLFALILVAMPTFGAVSAKLREPANSHHEAALPAIARRQWTPDVYFIVLDGYARGDVMKELFNFDNEPFLRRLEGKGFFVARQSTSNYCQTRLSLASTLNADYLENLVDMGSSDLLPIADLIRDNLVRKSLRPLGYKFVSFATGFQPTDVSDADFFLSPGQDRPEFSQLLLEMTPVDAWLSEYKHHDRYSSLRDRTEFLFDRLPTVAGRKEPTFTFAHVLSPHPPFVFGEHGEDVSPRRIPTRGRSTRMEPKDFGSPEYFREGYRNQSVYLTSRVERMIDQILENSPEPPVIILQSDHGSWLRYHPDDVEATDVHERFGILNCILIPGREGKKVEGISDGMTSVNTFRAVLKEVIGADLPLLPERNEFSPFHHPLDFTDVTARVHSQSERERKFTYPSEYLGIEQQF